MKDLLLEVFKKYGRWGLIFVVGLSASVWWTTHRAAAPGTEVSVFAGFIKYTKDRSTEASVTQSQPRSEPIPNPTGSASNPVVPVQPPAIEKVAVAARVDREQAPRSLQAAFPPEPPVEAPAVEEPPPQAAKPSKGPHGGVVLTIPAKPEWQKSEFTSTTIKVRSGQTLHFRASGEWTVGADWVGPDGGELEACKCPYVIDAANHAPLGALIGRIGYHGRPFLVGAQQSHRATEDEEGILFLGSNDNLGSCKGGAGRPRSCYNDNEGSMHVEVSLK